MKVDEQAKALVGRPEVGQKLLLVNRGKNLENLRCAAGASEATSSLPMIFSAGQCLAGIQSLHTFQSRADCLIPVM